MTIIRGFTLRWISFNACNKLKLAHVEEIRITSFERLQQLDSAETAQIGRDSHTISMCDKKKKKKKMPQCVEILEVAKATDFPAVQYTEGVRGASSAVLRIRPCNVNIQAVLRCLQGNPCIVGMLVTPRKPTRPSQSSYRCKRYLKQLM